MDIIHSSPDLSLASTLSSWLARTGNVSPLYLLCSNVFADVSRLRSGESCWYLKALACLNFHNLAAFISQIQRT